MLTLTIAVQFYRANYTSTSKSRCSNCYLP
jgi:hypothetical protein